MKQMEIRKESKKETNQCVDRIRKLGTLTRLISKGSHLRTENIHLVVCKPGDSGGSHHGLSEAEFRPATEC
jgi:hypothetical protein